MYLCFRIFLLSAQFWDDWCDDVLHLNHCSPQEIITLKWHIHDKNCIKDLKSVYVNFYWRELVKIWISSFLRKKFKPPFHRFFNIRPHEQTDRCCGRMQNWKYYKSVKELENEFNTDALFWNDPQWTLQGVPKKFLTEIKVKWSGGLFQIRVNVDSSKFLFLS